jgi:hypothetical protein
MKIVVIGGTDSLDRTVSKLRERGHEAVASTQHQG